ncbi:UNVERIFIED_ORG: hypothetical protein E4P37_16335 [Bacillus sp. AZ43]
MPHPAWWASNRTPPEFVTPDDTSAPTGAAPTSTASRPPVLAVHGRLVRVRYRAGRHRRGRLAGECLGAELRRPHAVTDAGHVRLADRIEPAVRALLEDLPGVSAAAGAAPTS